MRHVAANLLSLMIVAGLAAVVTIILAKQAFEATGPLAQETIVSIPSGTRLAEAADRLAEAGALPERSLSGAVSGPWLFRVGARYSGQDRALKAAEYRIPAEASMADILAIITSGRGVQLAITVPEGLTSWEVVRLLEAEEVLTGSIDTLPAEGTLAPDTYFVTRGTDRAELIARMQSAQDAILAEAWEARAQDLPLASPEEALILASIIEKEAAVAEERGQVASVFINRLRRGMRLQTDPTAVYGAIEGQGALNRPPTAPELRALNPWNTYQIDGLPQTPIANPGRDAIEAALNPDDTPYLFFVADGTGGHAFARTVAEHNRNVAAWRRFQAERDAAAEDRENTDQ